jgi:hypothetical protein
VKHPANRLTAGIGVGEAVWKRLGWRKWIVWISRMPGRFVDSLHLSTRRCFQTCLFAMLSSYRWGEEGKIPCGRRRVVVV